jgi:prevent-host-death family protein
LSNSYNGKDGSDWVHLLRRRQKEISVMTKTVSATEAKNTLGSLLGQLESKEDAVIIENRGVATAAIISIERFRALEALEERERRLRALENFRRLRAEVAEQTKDMTDEEIEAFIDEMATEIDANINARHRERVEQLRNVS